MNLTEPPAGEPDPDTYGTRVARASGCTDKRRFLTRRDAAHCASSLRREGRKGLAEYRCNFGEHWHIGHSTPGSATGLRRRDNR